MDAVLWANYFILLIVQIGAAILGWLGRYQAAWVSLGIAWGGMLAVRVLAQTVAPGAGDRRLDWMLGAALATAAITVLMLALASRLGCRARKPTREEPDYAALGRRLQEQADRTVLENKAARAMRKFG